MIDRKHLETLLIHGFVVAKRNPEINSAFVGVFMVHESGINIPCKDASEADGFAIVGNDLAELIFEAMMQVQS